MKTLPWRRRMRAGEWLRQGMVPVLLLLLLACGEGPRDEQQEAGGAAAGWSPGSPPRRMQASGIRQAPLVDGRLDEQAWQNTPWSHEFSDISSGALPPLRTRVRLMWDDQALYIGAMMEEPHLWATLTRRDAVIYRDPDFEVFLDPDGDGRHYFELEINPLGTEWDLLLTRPYLQDGSALNGFDLEGLQTAVHLQGSLNDPEDQDEWWSVEIAIPWTALEVHAGRPLPPRPGDIWRMNFSRVQWQVETVNGGYVKVTDEGGEPLPEDNWVWSPQGVINMHIPRHWGFVEFTAP